MSEIEKYRRFLKSDLWSRWDGIETDQRKGIAPPPVQKACEEGSAFVDLVARSEMTSGRMPLVEAIEKRRSRRKFTGGELSLEELSFLCWATQGLRGVLRDGAVTLRTVPSAGARHPFETYLLVNNVAGVAPGLYRYLPVDHRLVLESDDGSLVGDIDEACFGQFITTSSVVFIWTVVPYRTEWRYDILSHKVIALDAGHVCQNLYLAAEAIGAGTCAIGAYDQEKLDAALPVDGTEEFAIYVAPVGTPAGE